jgi:hypothetical protein
MAKITKKSKVAYLKHKLTTCSNWALRCLEVVYANQTADEKEFAHTKHDNGIGFTGTDGEFMSSLAEQYAHRKSLSPKQMCILMKRMGKYHKQVLAVTTDRILVTCMHKDGFVTTEQLETYEGDNFLAKV